MILSATTKRSLLQTKMLVRKLCPDVEIFDERVVEIGSDGCNGFAGVENDILVAYDVRARERTLGARFDTVSHSDFAANFTDLRQLVRARSRLYRSRFLQPNTHFAAFFELYKICKPLHRLQFKNSAKNRQTSYENE